MLHLRLTLCQIVSVAWEGFGAAQSWQALLQQQMHCLPPTLFCIRFRMFFRSAKISFPSLPLILSGFLISTGPLIAHVSDACDGSAKKSCRSQLKAFSEELQVEVP